MSTTMIPSPPGWTRYNADLPPYTPLVGLFWLRRSRRWAARTFTMVEAGDGDGMEIEFATQGEDVLGCPVYWTYAPTHPMP